MKKKIKLYLLSLILFMSAFVMSACGAKANLKFTEKDILIGVGEVVSLADYVMLENIELNKVQFVSSAPNIVAITSEQNLIAGSLEGVAIITAVGFEGSLQVTVEGVAGEFSAPRNIHYNAEMGFVQWEGVYYKNIVANEYKVILEKNGAVTENIVSDNKFTISQNDFGTFKIKLITLEKDGVRQSAESEEYVFEKLPAPTNIVYDEQTKTLSWKADDLVKDFRVKKDGVLSDVINSKEYHLDLLDEKTYTISVVSETLSNNKNVFCAESEKLTITRLKKPKLQNVDGSIIWEDEQQGVKQYVVKVFKVENDQEFEYLTHNIAFNGKDYSYRLSTGEIGRYKIYVTAEPKDLANNTMFLTSATSSVGAIDKLKNVTLEFNKENTEFSILNFNNANGLTIELISKKDGQIFKTHDISQTGKFVFNYEDAGEYEFYAVNKSKSITNEIDSDASNKITVTKLDKITSASHKVDNVGNYSISGLSLSNADKYTIRKIKDNTSEILSLNENNYYGKVDTIFSQAGEYTIEITASGNDNANFYTLDSVTTLKVERLKTAELIDNNKQIQWTPVGTASGIIYRYEIEGTETYSGSISGTSLNYAQYKAGNYTMKLYSTSSTLGDDKTLILDAFDFATITFVNQKQIALPTASITKSSTGYNLVINPIQEADKYTITVNNQILKTITHNNIENIVVDLNDALSVGGVGANGLNYVFKITANNSQNSNYLTSDECVINVNKLSAPDAFTLSANENILVEKPYNYIFETQIFVNDERTTTLNSDENIFVVKVKFVSDLQKYGNTYYLDSDESSFKLERLPVNIVAEGLDISWNAPNVSKTFNAILNFGTEGSMEQIDVTYIPSAKLTDFEWFGLNLSHGYTGYIQCNFEEFVGNISGSYVNGKFVSGTAGELTKYYISNKSNSINVNFANTQKNVQVVENSNKVQISWNLTDGAEYKLFDGVELVENNTGIVEITNEKFSEAKEYCLSLTEIIDGVQNVYVFYINRLHTVDVLNVDNNEVVFAELPTGSKKIEITKNGTSIDNLSSIGTTQQIIKARFLAKENENPYTFYLDSAETEYSFARLTNLDTASNLNIYNSIVSWNKEGEVPTTAYKYKVKFFGSESGERILSVNVEQTNSINLTTAENLEILNALTGIKKLAIQKYVEGYVAQKSKTNYLSSSYSNEVALKLIEAPKNIVLESLDAIEQKTIKISWTQNTNNVEIDKYVIKFVFNGTEELVETNGVYTVDENSSLLKDAGIWTISVKAVGANDSISSTFSEPIQVTRLSKAQNFVIGKDGVISWAEVSNANEYKVSYFHTANSAISGTETVLSNILSSNIFVSQLQEEFEGVVKANIYAVGDGTTTLSSYEETQITRLFKPVVIVDNNKIIIDNFATYPQGTKIFATAKIDDKQVLSQELTLKVENGRYVWYLPTEYSYIDDLGKTISVDMSTNKVISYEFNATNNAREYLNSNTTLLESTILSPLKNLRFARDDNGDIHFMADNTNTIITNVKFTLGDYTQTLTGNVDIVLDNDMLKKFDSSWEISLEAIGGKVGNANIVNSKIVKISGTKLATIEAISTNEGKIVWQEISGATDYRVIINDSIKKENYGQIRQEGLLGDSFASGEHTIIVKALGNVGLEPISTNVILDANYSNLYTANKLQEVADLSIKNGYFTFTEISGVEQYVLQVFTDIEQAHIAEYVLKEDKTLNNTETTKLYSNEELLTKINESQFLFVKFYNKTSKSNFVYSNFAKITVDSVQQDYLQVKLLQNASEKVALNYGKKPSNVIDYLTILGSWEQNTITDNGYLLKINNKLELTLENEFKLDKDANWTVGNHTISYMQLGSNGLSGGIAYLTYKFSEPISVQKLPPVSVYMVKMTTGAKELSVKFDAVNGADKYYSYLDNNFFKEHYDTQENIALNVDDVISGKTYNSFGMIAVSTLSEIKYLPSALNTVKMQIEDGGDWFDVKFSKLPKPVDPKFTNGSFYWELTDQQWINLFKDRLLNAETGKVMVITEPMYLTLDMLLTNNQKPLIIKFVSKSLPITTYTYTESISKFIYMPDTQYQALLNEIDNNFFLQFASQEQKQQLKDMLKQLQFSLKGGFSSLHFGFNKFASNLPVGEYEISVAMAGQNVYIETVDEQTSVKAMFTSDYLNIGTKYVAQGAVITAVATNGDYTIEFANVNVDSKYFTTEMPKYSLIGVYYDEELEQKKEKELAVISASAVNDSQILSFDLTSLINAEFLDKNFTELYVVLKGNNNNILNGKLSNIIKIAVLDPIEAKVEHGTIMWHSQENASKYTIRYKKLSDSSLGDVDFAYDEELDWHKWNATQLTEQTEYSVSIQACGMMDGRVKGGTIFRMSGKITDIGKVSKLKNVSSEINGIDIVNGIFEWNSVENATAYEVFYSKTQNGEKITNLVNTTSFETNVPDIDYYYYYFMAIGTESGQLSSASTTFVNSPISEYNLARRISHITNISFKNGIISFTPTQGYYTNYYKLTFYKLDLDGKRGDKIVIYSTKTTFDTNEFIGSQPLLAYGHYDLEIQATYQDKTPASTSTGGEALTYYLISRTDKQNKVASTSYFKFDFVKDIKVSNGVISWIFDNDGDINAMEYQFVLVFSADNKDTITKLVSPTNNALIDGQTRYFFNDVVYNGETQNTTVDSTTNINLSIYVQPVNNATQNYTTSKTINHESNIHQYQTIDETKISVKINQEDKLEIDWSQGVQEVGLGFKYEISLSIKGGDTQTVICDQPLFVVDNLSFTGGSGNVIVIKIRVIPTTDNYISSCWTNNKEIARPNPIDEQSLMYDQQSCVLSWNTYAGTENWSSYYYKITDVVTYFNNLGEQITEVYILSKEIGSTSIEKYTPFVIGNHNISIAVIAKNTNEGFISENVTYENAEFELFANGDGTTSNPYIISDQSHFANIKYRTQKDNVLNEYYKGTYINGELIIDDEKTITNENKYVFKQNNHLEIYKNSQIDNTLNNADFVFNGIYDADYYSLKLNYTFDNNNKDYSSVSLFRELGNGSEFKNAKLLFEINIENGGEKILGSGQNLYINLLSQINRGIISNVVIGENTQSINIGIEEIKLYLSFITNENYGNISYVENNYNVQIIDNESNASYASTIQYSPFVWINHNRIECTINKSNIYVVGTNIFVGGIVVTNTTNSIINECANLGAIDVFYMAKGSNSYIGGLVSNNKGDITYSYCTSQINVRAAGNVNPSHSVIGGLVGSSDADSISYSYSNVTINIETREINGQNSPIMVVYSLVGNMQNYQNEKYSCVYYKTGTNPINGSYGTNVKSFNDKPIDDGVELFTEGTKFNKTSGVTNNGNPKLNFELESQTTWK